MSRRALLLGATGLVGGLLLQRLLASAQWQQVTVIGRRAPAQTHPQLRFIQTDLDQLHDYAAEFSVDDVFCCLGTTIRQAGSKQDQQGAVGFHGPNSIAAPEGAAM